MEKLKEKLSNMNCSKVIDIATRDGDFIKKLSEGLASYEQIIGIDITDKGFIKAKSKFKGNDRIKFEVQDAYSTDYPDKYFDLVCISNSLHHMKDIRALLEEVKRIKKEDGLLIISEMPSDAQKGASLTHALVHRFDCLVDTHSGTYHNKTYSHEEIYNLITESGFKIVDHFDDVENNVEKNKSLGKRVEKTLDSLGDYKGTEIYEELSKLATEISNNFNNYGANRAIQYILFAK